MAVVGSCLLIGLEAACAYLVPTTPPTVVQQQTLHPSFAEQHQQQLHLFPPTTNLFAFIQPPGLGAPKASQANPGGAGNSEGNWWTPSSALDTDCEGRKVTATNQLTKECIYEKKVAEIKARQQISAQNGAYKVEKLKEAEDKAAAKAAAKAQRDAETKARQEKYATRR